MHVLLFLAGIICAGAGVATMAYGLVNPAFRLTDAILVSASVGAVGGLLMIGVGSALLHLRRIGEALDMRPMAQEVSALPPIISPLPVPPVTNSPMLQESAATAETSAGAPAHADASVAQAAARPAHSPPMRPAMTPPAAAVAAALEIGAPGAPNDPAAPPPPQERRILKSGVIEGMAYSLYSDGSVDAELKEGQRHFESISAWRAHMRELA